MKTITIHAYTIDEHPNKNAVYDWIRNNWHDLDQYCIDEMVDSLRALAEFHDCDLTYSISGTPNKYEFVSLTPRRQLFSFLDLDLTKKPDNWQECSLTGVCYDCIVCEPDSGKALERAVLKTIHRESRHIYSKAAVKEFCEANDYHFLKSGEFHS